MTLLKKVAPRFGTTPSSFSPKDCFTLENSAKNLIRQSISGKSHLKPFWRQKYFILSYSFSKLSGETIATFKTRCKNERLQAQMALRQQFNKTSSFQYYNSGIVYCDFNIHFK